MTEKEQAATQVMVCQAALNKPEWMVGQTQFGSAGIGYDLREAERIAKQTGYEDAHEIAESINLRAHNIQNARRR